MQMAPTSLQHEISEKYLGKILSEVVFVCLGCFILFVCGFCCLVWLVCFLESQVFPGYAVADPQLL